MSSVESPDDFVASVIGEATPGAEVKYGTVAALFENGTAKVLFAGEQSPSEKEYPYLAWYSPKVDDKIVLLKWDRTYIVLGKAAYGEQPYELDLSNYAKKDDITNALVDYVTADTFEDFNTAVNGSISELTEADIERPVTQDVQRMINTAISNAAFNYAKAGGLSVSELDSNASTGMTIITVNSIIRRLRTSGLIN